MTRTVDVRGHKLRTATQRRYVVVQLSWPRSIILRSDNLVTARKSAARWNGRYSTLAVVVDLTTGQEV